jgi:hypothetical protein
MRFVGKSKIGRLSAKKGKSYPQIRLPSQLTDTIGEIVNVFETERNGKRAFLLVTKQSVVENDKVLQPDEIVVKPCAKVAQSPAVILAERMFNSAELSETQQASECSQKPLSSIHRLVSCAASGFAYASPGSVAAYHGALSRLRLGFKSRLGRLVFDISGRGASAVKNESFEIIELRFKGGEALVVASIRLLLY